MNHQQEIHQFNKSHFREIDVPQHIVMMVVGDNVVVSSTIRMMVYTARLSFSFCSRSH